jgi:hypothetical protein
MAQVNMSPDESSLLVHSIKNKPWELFVGENKKVLLFAK